MTEEKFDFWCLVELFGHQRISGKCTEQNVAGTNMLRVDVPATKRQPAFTRILSSGSIYAINPISEEVALKLAETLDCAPITVWQVRTMFEQELKQLESGQKDEGPGF